MTQLPLFSKVNSFINDDPQPVAICVFLGDRGLDTFASSHETPRASIHSRLQSSLSLKTRINSDWVRVRCKQSHSAYNFSFHLFSMHIIVLIIILPLHIHIHHRTFGGSVSLYSKQVSLSPSFELNTRIIPLIFHYKVCEFKTSFSGITQLKSCQKIIEGKNYRI